MGLLTPLGLLGLIGIPILIIIYIIKPKYHEKKISSTFIWRLSLKYRKRKIPLQWLQRSLLFFVQVLIIGLTALLLARPLMKVSAEDGEKVVILDVSASMNSTDGSTTRLDKAIEALTDLADKASEENKLTIILADSTPEYLTRRETSPSYVKFLLSTITPTYEECNFDEALKLANTVIDENPATEVYFYSDCHYAQTGYVELVNFSANEWNAGILNFNPVFEGGYYNFQTQVGNYGKAAELKVTLSLDNGATIKEQTLRFAKDEVKDIVWPDLSAADYKDARLSLQVKDTSGKFVAVKDALAEDNEQYVQNLDNIKFNVQLVGVGNTFMSSALKAVGNIELYMPKTIAEVKTSEQDLYVFDGYIPQQLPTDGTVWILNPTAAIPGIDLTIGNAVTGNFRFESTSNNSEAYNIIMNHLTPSTIEVTKYTRVSNYSGFDVLMNCDGSPVLLSGRYGNAKVVIMPIDLHYSNLPITLNMAILINNMFDYCVNSTLEQSVYQVGEEVTLYTKPTTSQLRVNDTLHMASSSFTDKVSFVVDEPGIYSVEQTIDGRKVYDLFFVKISPNESNYKFTREILAVDQYINVETGVVGNPGGDSFDLEEATKYFAGALLALVIIEWGLQYREQY